MTIALTPLQGRASLQLRSSPLIVGIRAQGTICYIGSQHPFHIRPRPHARYLADTLRHLGCHVTLFVHTNPRNDAALWNCFQQSEFPVRCVRILDASQSGWHSGCGTAAQVKRIAPNNYTNYLEHVAQSLHISTSRILFIDSEVNHRCSPACTLVVESFDMLQRRGERRALRKAHRAKLGPGNDRTVDGADVAAQSASVSMQDTRHPTRAQLAQSYNRQVRDNLAKAQALTSRLTEEQRWVACVDAGHVSIAHARARSSLSSSVAVSASTEVWRSRATSGVPVDESSHPLSPPVAATRHGTVECSTDSTSFHDKAAGHARTAKTHNEHDKDHGMCGSENGETGHCAPKSTRTLTVCLPAKAACRAGSLCSSPHGYGAGSVSMPPHTVPAVDHTLAMVSQMITEMATSDVAVNDYLRVEPLIEKLRVPFYGLAYYLPAESCDAVSVMDWERTEVCVQHGAGTLPAIEDETTCVTPP